MENDVIRAMRRSAIATEYENGLGIVESNVLNIMINSSNTVSPLILFNHLLSDFAAAIRGIKQPIMMSKGIMFRNIRVIVASTIDRASFARGSRS